jgi:hypothetical protein
VNEEAVVKLVKEAMEREYVADPDSFDPKSRGQLCLDGYFNPDELEAMAWCIKNDKWPKRS